MDTVKNHFGSMVFDDRAMKATLSNAVYTSLKRTIGEGAELDIGVAKEWALPGAADHVKCRTGTFFVRFGQRQTEAIRKMVYCIRIITGKWEDYTYGSVW